jgi:hypothetical protein
MTSPNERLPRKPYRRPKLVVYGDIREITQAGPDKGMATDNLTGMNKTG